MSSLNNFLKNITISLLYIGLFFSLNALAKSYENVEEFVSAQQSIQVLMDPTPGYGNQTASINVMNRLRKMGFSRTFEIVYNDIADSSLKDKVTTLLGIPSTVPDDYTTTLPLFGQIHLISLTKQLAKLEEGNNPPEKVVLSVNGGDTFDVMGNYGYKYNHNAIMSVKVNPYIQFPSSIQHEKWNLNHRDPLELPESKNKFYSVPIYSLSDAKKFLLTDPQGLLLLEKKPALKIFIEGIEQQDFYMMPMYGSTLQARPDARQLHHMLRIIAGVRYAQLQDKPLQDKPIILGVFYDYKPEMAYLNTFLQSNHWGKDEGPGSTNARKVLNTLNVKNVLQFASISDTDASERIKRLKPGQILILSLEPLPKTMFDGIYNHIENNMLPAVREGANTFNSLALTGKTHFRCREGYERDGWEIGYDYLMRDEKFKKGFKEVIDNLCLADTDTRGTENDYPDSIWLTKENLYQQFGNYIIDARKPESAISLYFTRLKEAALKPENDRIRYVLSEAIKAIENEKNASLNIKK